MNKFCKHATILPGEDTLKRNICESFFNRVLDVPFWIKEVLYSKLSDTMDKPNKTDLYQTYIPILTYTGKNELSDKKCGFDNNIYNFLHYCDNELNILEIAVNAYLSIEEVSKFLILCIEQNFIETPKSKKITAMANYISGKTRIGEYFVQTGEISEEQLQQALDIHNNNKLGEKLINLKYISRNSINHIVKLKNEAQKRIILDYNLLPKTEAVYCDNNKKYEEEITALKAENEKLRKQMSRIHDLVKKNA